MPHMNVLHFASPFSLSMPMPATKEAEPAQVLAAVEKGGHTEPNSRVRAPGLSAVLTLGSAGVPAMTSETVMKAYSDEQNA